MHEILAIVSKSLSPTEGTTSSNSVYPTNRPTLTQSVDEHEPMRGWEHDIEDAEFDDLGEGAGFEGDLDMEDDD